MPPLHAWVVSVATGLPEARTLALAGGGAMLAHGFVDRETHDVDLFTDRDPDEAMRVTSALRVALAAQGMQIHAAPRPPHENRFVVVDVDGHQLQVEVFADGGRLREPVRLEVGPVLHADDLAADKVLALWGRLEPRDVVDVVALLERYPGARLVELAGAKDGGFTISSFLGALDAIARITDARWAAAGVEEASVARLTTVVTRWCEELR